MKFFQLFSAATFNAIRFFLGSIKSLIISWLAKRKKEGKSEPTLGTSYMGFERRLPYGLCYSGPKPRIVAIWQDKVHWDTAEHTERGLFSTEHEPRTRLGTICLENLPLLVKKKTNEQNKKTTLSSQLLIATSPRHLAQAWHFFFTLRPFENRGCPAKASHSPFVKLISRLRRNSSLQKG